MVNRRDFVKSLAALGGIAAAPGLLTGCCAGRACGASAAAGAGFRLGFAGYTFHRFKLDETLAMLKTWGVTELCAKDFHFPMDASAARLAALVKQCRDSGVSLYGAGPIMIRDADAARKAFDYCAALGVPTVVGVPGVQKDKTWYSDRKLCEVCSKLADEYRLDFAIHNHGANPKTGCPTLYPTLEKTYGFIGDLSPRMGFCMDVAYTAADGFDPAEIIRRYADRLFDVHLRNTALAGNGSSHAPADAGTIDYVKVFRALKAVGYRGVCGIEMSAAFGEPSEINPGADPSWLPRSVGYFRGLMAAV